MIGFDKAGPVSFRQGPSHRMLLFKKKFLEAIRCGEKTQTIRFWDRRRMKPGQRSYIPGIGYISILSVDPVEIDSLTDADAVPDGFESALFLKEELRTLYAGEIRKGFQAFRIRFSIFSPGEQHRMRQEKKRIKEEKMQSDRRNDDMKRKEQVEKTLAKLKNLLDD